MRKILLKEGQKLEDLDLYPQDEVWSHDGKTWLGVVNYEGVFVPYMECLN